MSQKRLEIVFDSNEGLNDFFERSSVENGVTIGMGAATFTLSAYEANKGFGFEIVGEILVHVAEAAAAHLIVEWLLKKLSRSAKFVRYKGKSYEITREGMMQLVGVLEREGGA